MDRSLLCGQSRALCSSPKADHRWDVWAATYLIGGGCSGDSFIDFRARLISQGRGWYQKAATAVEMVAVYLGVTVEALPGSLVMRPSCTRMT
jgi:hypothetical protein